MRTTNLAIVFTDIKGFTERTGRQTHEENRRMLRVHDGLLMPVFRAFDGRVVKTIGDAFLAVFASPTLAVLCGAAIQDRLWEYNRRAPEAERMHVRVAINVGEVREEKGDVFGEPVNIAARVEGLADAGEVLFTEAVFLAMNKAEAPAEDRGVHELKGISHPVRVYRVPPAPHRLAAAPGASGTGAEGTAGAAHAGAPSDPGEGPPFGGLGLARAGKLPPTDLDSLAKETDLVPELWAVTSGLMTRAGGAGAGLLTRGGPLWISLSRAAREMALEVKSRLLALPPRRRALTLAAIVLVPVALLLWLTRGDAVERALSRGDVRGAQALAAALPPGPARSYDEGRIAEERHAWSSAASDYLSAARAGEGRAISRLVQMTRSETCGAREHAAQALG
ncbi:MAG: adenylate/guanylate cyclase domain-containing protein, partial [Deltaproteobacteria bacterium]|nr:adenylate/guanylate cyclase domain-containing protein [Deltaproteobacteria bacterium]